MIHGGDVYNNKVNMDFSVNINPLGTPQSVLEAIRNSIDELACYPDIEQSEARAKIAEYEGVNREQVLAGNGASDLFMAVVRAINPGSALVFDPTFSGYSYVLNSMECRTRHVIVRESEGFLITEDYLRYLDERYDVLFLCNPSNPTGRMMKPYVLERFLDKALEIGTKVVLDESFFLMSDGADYALDDRTAKLISKYHNLYMIRSLTKTFALPGIRMGYLISDEANIRSVKGCLPEWNLSLPAQRAIASGMDVLMEGEYLKESLDLIKKERACLTETLTNMGYQVFESSAPFILFKGREDLAEALLKRGILIRDCSNYPGLYKGVFRIAVKDRKSNDILIDALREAAYE